MRILLVLLIAFVLQSLLSGLLGDSLSPPDLIYVAALMLASGLSPLAGLPLAFATGVFQDLVSSGIPGLHGVSLLFAVYAYYRLSRLVHPDELAGQVVIFGGSFAAKWLGTVLMAYWLRWEGFNPLSLWGVIIPEMILTLLVVPFAMGAYRRVFGAARESSGL